ncbi:MAG: glycoside hydrolase, partial [Chthoniobacterales bacterium]|nr:glycoside hydrolase [Chthoniobacterales bacterium]
LEIKDGKKKVVRRYASTDAAPRVDPKQLKIPRYWVRPPRGLSGEPGLHRFLWDMHYAQIPGVEPEFPMTAVYRNTAPEATSPWVSPGEYSAVLTANGKSYNQPLEVKMDPRVKTSASDLAEQFELSKRLYEARTKLEPISRSFISLNADLAKAQGRAAHNAVTKPLDTLGRTLQRFAAPDARPGAPLSLEVLDKVKRLFGNIQDVDAAPRPSVKVAVSDLEREAESVFERWRNVITQDLPALNRQLGAAGLGNIDSKPEEP